MRARYLDTQTSTFQTPDTYLGNIFNPASLNRYVYAFSNPLKYSDPTGHFNLFGAISSFASGVVQGAKKVVSAVVNTVKTVVKNVVNVITSTVSNLFNKAKDTAQEIYNAAKKGPGGVISYAKQKVETFQQKAVAATQKRYQQVREAIYKFSCGSAQYIKSATDAVGNVMASVDWSAVGHTALDIAGMAPVVGTAFDVANGVWYAAEGNYVDAAMSLASAIPVVGDALGAGKTLLKAGESIVPVAMNNSSTFKKILKDSNIDISKKPNPSLEENDLNFGGITKNAEKLRRQIEARGWTERKIMELVGTPAHTSKAKNKSNGNPTTAYFSADKAYVVVDDVTGEVIQVSDKFDAAWVPDSSIEDPL